jgi:Ca2+-binding EF-hand superfamily protein
MQKLRSSLQKKFDARKIGHKINYFDKKNGQYVTFKWFISDMRALRCKQSTGPIDIQVDTSSPTTM